MPCFDSHGPGKRTPDSKTIRNGSVAGSMNGGRTPARPVRSSRKRPITGSDDRFRLLYAVKLMDSGSCSSATRGSGLREVWSCAARESRREAALLHTMPLRRNSREMRAAARVPTTMLARQPSYRLSEAAQLLDMTRDVLTLPRPIMKRSAARTAAGGSHGDRSRTARCGSGRAQRFTMRLGACTHGAPAPP
jgi:hypothetical protein